MPLDVSRGPALGTPVRERLARDDGITRRLNPDYWRSHHQLVDHSQRGLLDGGPDEFSGNLHDFIADALAGATTEDPRTALNRMKLKRINAQRKQRARDDFFASVLANAAPTRRRFR